MRDDRWDAYPNDMRGWANLPTQSKDFNMFTSFHRLFIPYVNYAPPQLLPPPLITLKHSPVKPLSYTYPPVTKQKRKLKNECFLSQIKSRFFFL